MGQILSSDTIYATAFLTENGRKYLFDPIGSERFVTSSDGTVIDKFKIVNFSLSDPDINYSLNILNGILLETGDVMNISGKNEGCIKGTIFDTEQNLIVYDGIIGGNENGNAGTTTPSGIYELGTDVSTGIYSIEFDTIPVIPADIY